MARRTIRPPGWQVGRIDRMRHQAAEPGKRESFSGEERALDREEVEEAITVVRQGAVTRRVRQTRRLFSLSRPLGPVFWPEHDRHPPPPASDQPRRPGMRAAAAAGSSHRPWPAEDGEALPTEPGAPSARGRLIRVVEHGLPAGPREDHRPGSPDQPGPDDRDPAGRHPLFSHPHQGLVSARSSLIAFPSLTLPLFFSRDRPWPAPPGLAECGAQVSGQEQSRMRAKRAFPDWCIARFGQGPRPARLHAARAPLGKESPDIRGREDMDMGYCRPARFWYGGCGGTPASKSRVLSLRRAAKVHVCGRPMTRRWTRWQARRIRRSAASTHGR